MERNRNRNYAGLTFILGLLIGSVGLQLAKAQAIDDETLLQQQAPFGPPMSIFDCPPCPECPELETSEPSNTAAPGPSSPKSEELKNKVKEALEKIEAYEAKQFEQKSKVEPNPQKAE